MKLATVRTSSGTRAAVATEVGYRLLEAPDVGSLLKRPDWRQEATGASGPRLPVEATALAPVLPRPGKIVCVGLNYKAHILEMGRKLPDHPTLFAKYPEALIGSNDAIIHPEESSAMDWEAELGVVVGARARRVTGAFAEGAIAGFTVINDVTLRDWQYRTPMWLQGKTWEATTPIGPALVTSDELPGRCRPVTAVRCSINGVSMQDATTDDMVFDPVDLIEYVSRIVTLSPGDVIASGTPGGVASAQDPVRYLRPGDRVVTEIQGIGRLDNRVEAETRLPLTSAQ